MNRRSFMAGLAGLAAIPSFVRDTSEVRQQIDSELTKEAERCVESLMDLPIIEVFGNNSEAFRRYVERAIQSQVLPDGWRLKCAFSAQQHDVLGVWLDKPDTCYCVSEVISWREPLRNLAVMLAVIESFTERTFYVKIHGLPVVWNDSLTV